jgi:hypothetical protein
MRITAAFLFLALLGSAFAAAPPPDVLMPAAIAGVLASAIIGVLYMLAKFSEDAPLEAHVRELLQELVSGAVVVGIVYAVVVGSIDLMPTLVGQSQASMDTIVMEKIGDLNSGYMGNLTYDYEIAIKVANRIGMVSSYYYSKTLGYIFYFGTMQSPYQGMAGLRISLTQLANELGTGLLIYETIKMLYYFLTNISYMVFGIGFALRIIPFTRKAGGMVIAIGFAAAVLYPYATYLSTVLHDQIIQEAANNNVAIHSQILSGDLDKISLDLPGILVTLCTDDFIRTFTALNEFGWWLIICTPLCIIQCVGQCAGTLWGFAACFAACFFLQCWPPIFGTCWNISYNVYNGVQAALTLASSVAAVAVGNRLAGSVGDPGGMYDIVVGKLIMPVSAAAALPIMESVFIGGIVIAGARSLSATFGGDIQIVGLGRLV